MLTENEIRKYATLLWILDGANLESKEKEMERWLQAEFAAEIAVCRDPSFLEWLKRF